MKFLTTLLFVVFTLTLTAQDAKEAYLMEGAEATCNCISDEGRSNLESMEMRLGLCLLEFVNADRDRYESFYGPLDFTDQAALESIGADFGVTMMSVCPETMMTIAEGSMIEEEQPARNISVIQGKVLSISDDEFTVVTFREENGRPVKVLWLDYFPGAELLTEADSDQTLSVSFETRDIYNGKTGDYVTRRVLTGVSR